MPDLLAAIGVAQLKKADEFQEKRRQIAATYLRSLGRIDELEMPPIGNSDNTHSWHLFVLRFRPSMLEINRSEIIRKMKECGIGTSVHFIPLHLHPYYQQTFSYSIGDFPQAEDAYNRCVSLPIYPDMSSFEVERVIRAIEGIVIKNRRRVLAGAV
jgi:perosamine synthetase